MSTDQETSIAAHDERLPLDVELAIDFVRAAGGEVSAETIGLMCQVQRGEITSEGLIWKLTEKYRRSSA